MAIKGSKIVVKQGDGASPAEAFTAIAGGRTTNWTLGGSEADTTDWSNTNTTYLDSIPDFGVTCEVVFKDKAAINGLIADRLAGTERNYQVDLGFGVFEGPMLITSLTGSGGMSDVASSSVSIRATGNVTYTPAA